MKTQLASRIQWLFPVDREVYGTRRAGADEPPPCARCGGAGYGAAGMRQAVVFDTRVRGTTWKDRALGAIHRGCVPVRDEFKGAGVPARMRGGR